MAKVTITFNDTEEEGGINFRVEFDPPIKDADEYLTHAQAEAAYVLEIMQRRASGMTLREIAEELDEGPYGSVVEGSVDIETIYAETEAENEEDLS